MILTGLLDPGTYAVFQTFASNQTGESSPVSRNVQSPDLEPVRMEAT